VERSHGYDLNPVPRARRSRQSGPHLEGNATQIICPEYEEATGLCRLKKTALEGGPLAQLLERLSEDTLHARGPLCMFRAA
jgi:hypothetical protein